MKNKLTGFRLETVRRTACYEHDGQLFYSIYHGRIAWYDEGVRRWTTESKTGRVSRGDAMKDAQSLAHDAIIQNNLSEGMIIP